MMRRGSQMPTLSSPTVSPADRGGLLARTALCGALSGLALLPAGAHALPTGASPQVNAGGVAPVICDLISAKSESAS